MTEKATFGLNENAAAALSYIPYLGGVVFFLFEKENKTVRFHALQSISLTIILVVVRIIAMYLLGIPASNWIGSVLNKVVEIGAPVIILLMAYFSFKNKMIKLPVIGEVCGKYA